MSISLVLKRKGYISTKRWKYNEETKEGGWEIKELKEFNTILDFLKYNVELEEGYTLRDWFHMILNYPNLQKIDKYFESYLEEFRLCPQSDCFSERMPSLQFTKTINITLYKNDNKEEKLKNDVEIYNSFSGNRQNSDEPDWGLDFLPLKEYLDTPIKLGKGILIKEDHNLPIKESYKTEEYETTYALWDIVQYIIWEISFYGTPERRDQESEELSEIHTEIENGKSKLTLLDED